MRSDKLNFALSDWFGFGFIGFETRISLICTKRPPSPCFAMTSAQQQATLTAANCDVAFDNLTRQLYATDASIYQIEPLAVAFPRNARQASAMIKAAAQAGIGHSARRGHGPGGRRDRRGPGH